MPEILRVVIDTNHIMSAILSARGASAKLLDWMTREEDYFHLLMSQPIWDEYSTPPIRPINSPFPEFQAARRVKHLTPAVAGYPLVTLTRV